MYKLFLFTLVTLSLLCAPPSAVAQSSGDKPYEFSFQGGPLLPSHVPRVAEILMGVDFRGTVPTGKGEFELDGFFANGSGTTYRTVSVDYRADLGADVFPVMFLLGLNADFFDTDDGQHRFSGGWHFGGAVFQPLGADFALREDFRYRFGPGQSLLIGVGLSYVFPK